MPISPSMSGCEQVFGAHAVIHIGKHGNLEWLPGKATALSAECFPEIALGPVAAALPVHRQRSRRGHPGQAPHRCRHHRSPDPAADPRRNLRAAARARSADRRILPWQPASIARAPEAAPPPHRSSLSSRSGIDRDAAICDVIADDSALARLDAWLCDLKESQIRDGLHILGTSPEGRLRDRSPGGAVPSAARPGDRPATPRCIRALAAGSRPRLRSAGCRLADPGRAAALPSLTASMPLHGARRATRSSGWRRWPPPLLAGSAAPPGPATHCRPGLRSRAGSGRPSGPAAARDRRPARRPRRPLRPARPVRCAEPRSARRPADRAQFLLARQPRGADPRRLATSAGAPPRRCSPAISRSTATTRRPSALSAWGTSNMRTGGDDIAQALALIGARPRLGAASRPRHRVRDPAAGRARPPARRRDLAHLRLLPRCLSRCRSSCIDKAVRAVGELRRGAGDNPLRRACSEDQAMLAQSGHRRRGCPAPRRSSHLRLASPAPTAPACRR